jgi:hypothetical protein
MVEKWREHRFKKYQRSDFAPFSADAVRMVANLAAAYGLCHRPVRRIGRSGVLNRSKRDPRDLQGATTTRRGK